MSGMKFLTTQNIFIAILAAILLAALYSYSFSKTHWYDGMTSSDASGNQVDQSESGMVTKVSASENQHSRITDPSELLPKDVNSQWSSLNPNINSNNVNNGSLLPAGAHIGLDTVGNTQKNVSYDLRSQPIVPKVTVSPWNNSTIEPDIARVPFEIGSNCPGMP